MRKFEGIDVTPLKIISDTNGDVMHALKENEATFSKFGEAYFSSVKQNVVKGWKKHKIMISNIVVPVGEIRFVFYDDRNHSKTQGKFFEISLSKENYCRLTVQPGIWMAFQGIGKDLNLLLNISSITHDPLECENVPIKSNKIKFNF